MSIKISSRARSTVLTASVVLFGMPVTDVEVVPPMGSPFQLPDSMKPDFTGKIKADFTFKVGSLSSSSGKVELAVAYSSTGASGEVAIKTYYAGPTSYVASRDDVFGTSFEPTAACPESGACDTMFVAGWNARSRRAVIERWTVKTLAVGEAIGGSGAGPVPTLSALDFDRREVWSATGVQARPIEAMGFDVIGSKLYVVEYGPEGRLCSLDLDAPGPWDLEWVADESTVPGLKDVASISTGYHDDFGTVFLMRLRRAWEPSYPKAVRLFRDHDGDLEPDFDVLEYLTTAEYRALMPQAGWRATW